MAKGFNLTAQINLQGPSNVNVIVSNIKKQLGTISANVNLKIDPASAKTVASLNSSLKQLNSTLKTTASSATNAADAVRDLLSAMRGVSSLKIPTQISSSLTNVASSSASAQKALAASRTEIEEFGNQAGLAVRRFAAFSTVTSVIYGLTGAISNGISEFIDFDKQLTRISQVTGESKDGLGRLKGTIASLSTGLGVTAKDLANVSVTLSQAGLSARDTEQALKALALSALTPSFDDMNQTVEGSIALMRQFKIGSNELEQALGSINAVSAKFAVESSDIISAIQRTGGVFAAASKGVSEGKDALNEFIAVFTSVRATTRESAETIATGLRTIFTRLQRGDTIEALKEYGVNLTDLDGKFVGAYKAVQLLSEGLGQIDPRDLKFSKIVEELGGFRQIGKVIPLIQEFTTAQQALQVAQSGQGSLASDAAKGQLALAVQISKTKQEFLSLIRSIGDTDSFQKMVTVGLSLASALIKVADAAKGIIPLIGLFAAFKGASAIRQFSAGFGTGFSGGAAKQNNRPLGFATGGLVPGQGNSDSVSARLTPGEFVVRKNAVKAIGTQNLHRMNRYAAGGPISNFGGGVGSLVVRDNKDIDIGLTNDIYEANVFKAPIIIKSISRNKIGRSTGAKVQYGGQEKNTVFNPNDLSSRKFENIAQQVTGGTLISAGNYPVDIKGKNNLYEVKYKEVPEPDINIAKKSLLYYLTSGTPFNHNWTTPIAKKGITISGRNIKGIRGLLTPASDKLVGSDPITQLYPEFRIDPTNVNIEAISSKIGEKQKEFRSRRTNIGYRNTLSNTVLRMGQDVQSIETAKNFNGAMVDVSKGTAASLNMGLNAGGSVRKFVNAGIVTPTSGKAATSTDIFRVLSLDEVIKDTGSNAGDIQRILKKRNALSPSEQAIKDKILAAYTKKASGIQTANNLDIQKATTEGLLFGAAGFKGKAFATSPRMDIPGLQNPVKVRITSGVLDKEAAGRDIKRMTQAMSGVSAKSTKNIQIRDLLKQVGPIYSDFDRTLAFGADKILADPKTPRFSEFANRDKVKDALNKATLSKLGRALVGQVRKTPEFLDNLHVISARPQSTMDLIGAWLAKNKLPIPASRIKGVGGPDRTAEQIAQLKLKEMDASGSFIDDDERNIDAAKAVGMNTYLYKDKKVNASDRKKMGEANAQGYMAESIIHQLGGPIGNKSATNYGIDFPDGLQDAAKYFKLPPNIPTDAKLTLNGPAELKGQIGNYLKARGYAGGGSVKTDYYSLEKNSGLKSFEFDNAVKFAKTMNYSMSEFQTYVKKLQTEKQSKSGLKTDKDSLAKSLMSGTPTATSRQMSLAESLKGPADAGYRPILTEAQRVAAARADVRNATRGFASGGLVPGVGDQDTVSANLNVGDFVIRKKAVATIGANNLSLLNKRASGGEINNTVPALLTPGEFVINRKTASRIGTATLNRLNHADKASKFNNGGPVGSVQEFAIGGAVQRLFFGGPTLPAKPSNPTEGNVQISTTVGDQLRGMVTALNDLGISSSKTAEIIKNGGQISYQAAIKAYSADIQKMRLNGASAIQVADAEKKLRDIRADAAKNIETRQKLGNISGESLQGIESTAQAQIEKLTDQKRRNLKKRGVTGEEADKVLEGSAANIQKIAYQNAADSQGGVDLKGMGLNGQDMQKYIQRSMMDAKTLQQMNTQYLQSRQRDLEAVGHSAEEARKIAQKEIKEREAILSDVAKSRGMTDPTSKGSGQQFSQRMMTAGFMLPMVGSTMASMINPETSASNAATSAGIQGATNTVGMGLGTMSMLPMDKLGKFGGMLGMAAVAAAAVGQAMIDARNATIEFEKKIRQNKAEKALEEVAKTFSKLEKDMNNVDLKKAITDKLLEASSNIKMSVEAETKQAKAYWTNLLDSYFAGGTFGGNQIENTKAAERSQILDKKGILAYFNSTGFGQAMQGNFGKAGDDRADLERSANMRSLAPEMAQTNAKMFADTANQINQAMEQRFKSGENLKDVMGTNPAGVEEFKQFAEVLSKANAAVGEQILSIQSNISLDENQKKAKIEAIQAAYAESEARRIYGVVSRQKEMKALEQSTSLFSRSLERMYQNMEQSINRTIFTLDKMSKELDLVAASFKGEATVGQGSLDSINVLQNPRAYSKQDRGSARDQASSFFSGNRDLVKGLLNAGDNLEQVIMSTISNTMREGGGKATNTKIGMDIEKNVKAQLANLSLPSDVGDKLATEVQKALGDLRKDNSGQVDFSQLAEKIPQLSKVIESAKRAQEVALKALENWQNALNNYSARTNQLVDLQVDTNNRLRKSTQILADSQIDLAKSLGQDIGISDTRRVAEFKTGQLTGGLTAPKDIADNILNLENNRRAQEAGSTVARNRGAAGVDDFMNMQKGLKDTNTALRENYEALKNLAENSDVASAALGKIQEAQQKNQGRVSFIEKLVTSTPDEMDGLGRALGRLQTNMNGQVNTIQRSQGAQQAYYEALQNGASGFEAMKAAQAAFANERKETLGALNDIIPFLGNNKQSNNIKANVLEGMLQESGQGISPIMQQVLTTLRNPQADPETQAAMAQYQQATNLQSEANRQLAMLNTNLAGQIADASAKALKDALTGTALTFQNAELTNIREDVAVIKNLIGAGTTTPTTKASGGVIYAAAGMGIDFSPKGTDTVPAMLTPGEFVVNRAATQRNLPLLKSINSQKHSSGGPVRYYAGGGYVSTIVKDEYNNDIKGDGLQVTDQPYMDPDSPSFKDLLENNIQRVYKGYKNFTRDQAGQDLIYSKNRWNSAGTGSIPFRRGKLIPGAAPNIEVDTSRGAYDGYFIYSMNQPVEVDPETETKFVGNLLSQNPLQTKQIQKREIDSYKDKIRDIQGNVGIEWGSLGDPYGVDSQESIDRLPGLQGEKYNPNLTTGKNVGFMLMNTDIRPTSNSVETDRTHFQKIWDEMVSDIRVKWAGTIVSPHAKGTAAALSLDDSEEGADQRVRPGTTTVNLGQLPRTRTLSSADADRLFEDPNFKSKKTDIDKLVEQNKANKIVYDSTVSAVDGDNFKFVKTNTHTKLNQLQQQLQRLYENRSLVENLTPASEFLNYGALFAKDPIVDLHVLAESQNDALRQKMKELEGIPNVRKDKGWDTLNVSTRGPRFAQDWMDGGPLVIQNDKGVGKFFPWIANLDPTTLLSNLETEVRQKQEDLGTGKDYGFKVSQIAHPVNEKLPAPLGNMSLAHTEQYLKYTGPLWNPGDPNADASGFLTDAPLRDYYVVKPTPQKNDMFQSAEKAFKNQRNFARQNKPFDLSDFINSLKPAQTQTIADYAKDPTDVQLMTDLKNIFVGVNPSLITATDKGRPIGLEGFDLFSKEDNNPVNLNIGDYLINAVQEFANQEKAKALGVTGEVDNAKGLSIGIADADKQKASVDLTRGALNVFGRSKIPGFANGWLARYIGRMPSILGMAKNNNILKSGTSYIANVFNEAGAYASKLFQMARNPQQYNALKEAYVMISGATSAFDGLSNGDTRFLKLLQDQGDYSSLFRSLGASSGFQKAANNELTADYQAQLGQELKGSKIRKVGADGSLSYADFNNSVPKTYQDLVDTALNPYNEFTSPSIRKGLINTLITDISNGRDSLGMPFFDKRTLDYINNNLRTLQSWYGGDGNAWPGQDSFYDETLDAKTRTDSVINALNNNVAGGLLDQANLANTQLGVATRFGNLPSAQWFEARKIAQPQFRATGGMIYASEGQMVNFQPRGTDTVPAMLTPGEFVINRQATQKNLPLLQSINNGNHYSKGGSVNYLAKGGEAKPINAVGGYSVEEKPEDKDSPLTKYKISSILYPYASYPFDERGYSQDLPPELKILNNLGSYGGGGGYTNTFFGNDLARSLQSIRINRNNRFASDSAVNDSAAEFIKQFKFRDIDNNDKLTGFDFSSFLSDSDNILGLIDPDLGDGFSPKNLIAWKKAADRVNARSSAKAVIANLTPDLENIKAVIQDQHPVDGSHNTNDRNSYGAQGRSAIAMKMLIYNVIEAWKKDSIESIQGLGSDNAEVNAQQVAEDIYKGNKTPLTEKLVNWLNKKEGAKTLGEKARELFPGRMPTDSDYDAPFGEAGLGDYGSRLSDLFKNAPEFIAALYKGETPLAKGKKSIFSLLSQGARVKGIEALIKARTLFSGSDQSVIDNRQVYSDPSRTPENTIGRDKLVYRDSPMGPVFGADQDQSGLTAAEKAKIEERLREHELDNTGSSPSHAMRDPRFTTTVGNDLNWDKDGDGRVSKEEWLEKFSGMDNGGKRLFSKYDLNNNGFLELKEFTKFYNESKGTLGPENDAAAVDLGRSINERKNNNKPKEKPVDLLTAMLGDKKLLAALKNNSISSIENTFMPKDLKGIKRKDIDEPQILKELEKQYSEFFSNTTAVPNILNEELPLPYYIDDKFHNLFNSRNETSDLDSFNSYTIEGINGVYGNITYRTNKNTAYKLLQEKNFDFDKSPWTEIIAPYKNPKYLLPNGSRSVIDAVKNNAAHWLNFTTFPNNDLDKFSGSNFFDKSFIGLIPYKFNAEQQDDGGQWPIPPGQQAGNSVPPGQQGGTVPPGQPPTGTSSPPPPGSAVPPNPPANKDLVGPFARDKYYDELTYKEYLASLIKSGKSPEAPDKKLFTTPALYTIGPDGQKVRLTAYDTRETERRIGGGKPIDKDDINHAEVEKLANQIFFDYNNAQIGLSAFKNPRGDANSKDMALEGIEGDYGNLVNKVTKLSTLTNLSRMNNKPIMVGEDKKIPFSIDDVVGRLRVMREIYNNEILAKKKEKLDKVNDSILDDFFSSTAKIAETNNVPTPADGKPFTGKEVRTNRGIPGPVRMPVRGMAGVETQYKNSYSHYRRILGEYNYHQNIGRGKQYAQGNKTTSRVAKTLSSGGMVYASTGMLIPYAPKGTDTVPAMLTPGEFVVNRAATQANLPLLQSINKNKGGEISYYANGGVADMGPSSSDSMNRNVRKISKGGTVYAAEGQLINFEPRGTDTVPAMLTPGEFVVNRAATQQNLSLLKAINNDNYKASSKEYSQGGVVYLVKGAEVTEEEKAQRRQEGQDQNAVRGLENSAAGQIILRVKAQADSYPNLFDAIDPNAINELLNKNDLIAKYEDAWKTMDPSARYSSAQQQFKTDKARIDYLEEIYKNSGDALGAIKQSSLVSRANYITAGGKSITDILKGQEGAIKEHNAIHEAWVELFKKHPEFRSGPVSAGSTQAAGTGSVAGQTTVAAAGKQYGGMIYANHGMMIPYVPRGSDTVPAMLTPGEFVVNRASTQQNLPLLQAINNNRYSRGGSVKYLANGGMTDESGAGGGVSNTSGLSAPNMDGLSQFTTKFAEFIGQLKSINLPPVINVMGNHKVEVIFNGAEVLRELQPQISQLVVSQVGNAMKTISDQTEGGIKYQV
jgi:TP901 family phage tail tape measure protein